MSTTYNAHSPYYSTPIFAGKFLDVMGYRPITKLVSDTLYQIDKFYEYRPNLLASDLYSDPALWWVFAVRNPNVLKDPLFDFVAGNIIYLPSMETLRTDLGL